MLTIDLKKQLIDKIHSTNNTSLLEEIYRIMEVDEEAEEVYMLSDSQKKSIDKGLEDMANGKFISDDEANNEIDEWLKK